MRWIALALPLLACRVENKVETSPDDDPGGDSAAPDGGDCVPEDEVCDGEDNDCDGEVDEGLDQTWYADTDGDGWGDADAPVEACARPEDTVEDAGDCDDGDATIHPHAAEICDDRDQDCDGRVDEDLPMGLWFTDADGDGWGDPDAPVEACAQPEGTTDALADCDDTDASRHLCQSCWEILQSGLSTGDGDYALSTPDCGEVTRFCDMTTDGGGWTQVVDLDAATDGCPGDWQQETLSFATVCARTASDPSELIRSATFETCGIAYDGVLGNAVLYQNGSTDAFGDLPSTSIDDAYGDVVSVTVGDPRAHVFSWVFGFLAGGTDDSNCPAIGGAAPPSWVGTDYLCATGNPSSTTNQRIWYDTPLFAADWFQVGLAASTTDPIEVRLIGTHNTADEDMGVETMRLRIR